MTTKHKVLHNNRPIGIVYVSPHPAIADHKIGSIIPIARKGKWIDNTAEIIFENPVHDIYPAATPSEKIAEDLVGQAGIEWWKVTLVEDALV